MGRGTVSCSDTKRSAASPSARTIPQRSHWQAGYRTDDTLMIKPVHTSCYCVTAGYIMERVHKTIWTGLMTFFPSFLKFDGKTDGSWEQLRLFNPDLINIPFCQKTNRILVFPLTLTPPHTEQMVTMVLETEVKEVQVLQESLEGATLVFLFVTERPWKSSLTDWLSVASEWASGVVALLLSCFAASAVNPKRAGGSLVEAEASLSLAPPPASCKTLLGVS